MKFIERTLPENEEIELPITFHWTHSFFAWLSLVFLGWLLIGIFIFIARYIEKWTTERALTNKRLIIKRGLISRKTEEISCNRIEEVNLSQTNERVSISFTSLAPFRSLRYSGPLQALR